MWWMRRMGRSRVSGRVWVWGLLVFVGLAVLGHFDPNPGGVAPVRPAVMAAAEGGGHSLVHQAQHAAHHIPHRVPWWARPQHYAGSGGQQGGSAGESRAGNDAVVDGLSKLY